jgi:hypothetical protein
MRRWQLKQASRESCIPPLKSTVRASSCFLHPHTSCILMPHASVSATACTTARLSNRSGICKAARRSVAMKTSTRARCPCRHSDMSGRVAVLLLNPSIFACQGRHRVVGYKAVFFFCLEVSLPRALAMDGATGRAADGTGVSLLLARQGGRGTQTHPCAPQDRLTDESGRHAHARGRAYELLKNVAAVA